MGVRNNFAFKSEVWLYPSEQASWHFISVPKKESSYIKESFGKKSRGWGSLPVSVKIGKTSWPTSIFPDKKSGEYILPLKSSVRKKEHINKGDFIECLIKIEINR